MLGEGYAFRRQESLVIRAGGGEYAMSLVCHIFDAIM